MHAWESIQKSVDYIEINLEEQFEVESLAASVHLSPFYFQRLFRRLVHKPLKEYIRLRRLARACEDLITTDLRIIDIAIAYGFQSHEVFTRNFKDAFTMTPEKYRKHPVRLNHFNKPELLLNYTLIDENVPLIADGIVLQIQRKTLYNKRLFLGRSKQVSTSQIPVGYDTGVDSLSDLWDAIHLECRDMQYLKSEGDKIGVAYMGESEGFYSYFAGAEVTSNKTVLDYELWTLPIGEYVVCSFEAENFELLVTDALYKAFQYLFQTWLPQHNLETTPFSYELYKPQSSDTAYMEVWVTPITRRKSYE